MRLPDPLWSEFTSAPFARWIPEADFKYRADHIRQLLQIQFDPLPTEVEIGCNRGNFLRGLCSGRPNTHFLGIEIRPSLAATSQRLLDRHHLTNGHAIAADAKLAIPILFAAQPLHAAYLLFPDPWWKQRHAKRRLVDPDFLLMLRHHLAPNGLLIVMSDVDDYADFLREHLDGFQPIPRDAVPASDLWHLSTRERYCEELGIPINRFYFRRNA